MPVWMAGEASRGLVHGGVMAALLKGFLQDSAILPNLG